MKAKKLFRRVVHEELFVKDNFHGEKTRGVSQREWDGFKLSHFGMFMVKAALDPEETAKTAHQELAKMLDTSNRQVIVWRTINDMNAESSVMSAAINNTLESFDKPIPQCIATLALELAMFSAEAQHVAEEIRGEADRGPRVVVEWSGRNDF